MERGKTLNNYTSYSKLINSFSEEKSISKNFTRNKKNIKLYFEKIFDDLQSRVEGKTTNVILNGYMSLPLLITDQIYKIFEGTGSFSFNREMTLSSLSSPQKNLSIEKERCRLKSC